MGFGLIIIGDELLAGQREDRHLVRFREMLRVRGHTLAWCWILPDEPDRLTAHLRSSMAGTNPVFCCGGIGATPDDRTREAAAAAANVPLARHPEAQDLIESRFGMDAYPHRIMMADLPCGSELIPNPYNKVPGFCLRDHFFLPGFPQMAWPMAEWVLEHRFTRGGKAPRESAVVVTGVPESTLIPLMRRFTAQYPDLKLFSLPHLGAHKSVELGFRGRDGLDQAMEELQGALEEQGFEFESKE
jgi:molybdopterin-biosynthesis enzyme MoeA-like protein